ncbi:MAG: hypothetical protein HYV97_08250 [Bdellovibrio sp.]|nr:hypothetical protein [Bdellovibrio sp.]
MKKIVFSVVIFIALLSVGLYYYRERAAGPDQLAQVDEVLRPNDSELKNPEKTGTVSEVKKDHRDKVQQSKSDEDDGDEGPSDNLAEDMLGSGDEGSGNPQNEKSLNEEDADKMTAYFEATEKAWNDRMDHFITDELHLPIKVLKEYKVLREGFDRDKMEAFEDFHKYMRDKHGDNYSYNPTKDEEQFANKVKDQYDSKLRQLFGQEHYLEYREVRDQFNKKLKAEQNPEIGVYYIDI